MDKIVEKLEKLNDWGLGRVTGYMEDVDSLGDANSDFTLEKYLTEKK